VVVGLDNPGQDRRLGAADAGIEVVDERTVGDRRDRAVDDRLDDRVVEPAPGGHEVAAAGGELPEVAVHVAVEVDESASLVQRPRVRRGEPCVRRDARTQ
jgi:hypothetical protein